MKKTHSNLMLLGALRGSASGVAEKNLSRRGAEGFFSGTVKATA
jgi:hypothetical protein